MLFSPVYRVWCMDIKEKEQERQFMMLQITQLRSDSDLIQSLTGYDHIFCLTQRHWFPLQIKNTLSDTHNWIVVPSCPYHGFILFRYRLIWHQSDVWLRVWSLICKKDIRGIIRALYKLEKNSKIMSLWKSVLTGTLNISLLSYRFTFHRLCYPCMCIKQ